VAKEPTAEEKIRFVLEERRDPLNLEVMYLTLEQITEMTGVTRKTVENRCSRMVGAGKLVRRAAGEYGLPLPKPEDVDSPVDSM
jgi:predicted transcriptional regulator of viral defense system